MLKGSSWFSGSAGRQLCPFHSFMESLVPGQGFLDASLGNNYLKCLRWPSSGIAHLTRREISHELTDLLWFSLCQNYVEEEAGNNLELCTERSDTNKRERSLTIFFRPPWTSVQCDKPAILWQLLLQRLSHLTT